MTVRVDYLVVHADDIEVRPALEALLADAWPEDISDDPAEASDIAVRYRLSRADGTSVCGVTLTAQLLDGDEGRLVAAFTAAVRDAEEEGIAHVVKLSDSSLLEANLARVAEIFDIEMRLREALTIIFLTTYDNQYYELLREVNVTIQPDSGEAEGLRARAENEFFFLLFSDYRLVDQRRQPKTAADLVNILAEISTLDELHDRLRPTVLREEYTEFVASLRSALDPVEKLRNAVAHNRAPSRKILDDYELGRERLLAVLGDFFETLPRAQD